MFQRKAIILFFFGVILSCNAPKTQKVEIKKTDAGHQLFRNEEPYYIRGAGIEAHYDMLAEYGGNSIRTWGINQWEEAFRKAEKYGFTVCAGMWLDQEQQGFDYNDVEAVNRQFEKFKEPIRKYKDHPALLMWGIGNELDLNYTNINVWNAVEQVARFIHEVDGNHPTMTATAFIEKEEVELIQQRCPHIDILGVNAYAGLPVLSEFLKNFGWTKPYVLGEWGTFGHWEVGTTLWNEPIEFTSSEKAALYLNEYQNHIITDPNCVGAYVFFWGAKQERTPTWYSLFLPDGAKTESVDVLHYLWKEHWPANRAPFLDSLRIDGMSAHSSVTFAPNTPHRADVWTTDPEDDSLKIVWEILHETTDKRTGGEEEQKPPAVNGLVIQHQANTLTFRAPGGEGPYRLFVYVYDLNGGAAHANIPFYVKADQKNQDLD